MTTTRSHLITSLTVEPGDVLSLGAGTLNMRAVEVEAVERSVPNPWGYVSARVTFTDASEEDLVMYGGVIYHRVGA